MTTAIEQAPTHNEEAINALSLQFTLPYLSKLSKGYEASKIHRSNGAIFWDSITGRGVLVSPKIRSFFLDKTDSVNVKTS